MNILIHGYRFDLTCFACPEQWDVYDSNDTQVAYIRLRHGTMKVHCPDYGGDIVYEVRPMGDGIFNDSERLIHLTAATTAIQNWIISQKFKAIQWNDVEE